MSHQTPPHISSAGIELSVTPDEHLIIRRAAELRGWSLTEYIRCALLDRAERDLYEQATLEWATPASTAPAEPVITTVEILGAA